MNQTFERVRGIVAAYLKVPPEQIQLDTRLSDIGLDSLGALELVFEIEEAFKVRIPDERVAEFQTLRSGCEFLESLTSR
jgi:acyl carrier protein